MHILDIFKSWWPLQLIDDEGNFKGHLLFKWTLNQTDVILYYLCNPACQAFISVRLYLSLIFCNFCKSTPLTSFCMWHEEEEWRASALFTVALNLTGSRSPQPRAVFRNAAFAFKTLIKWWTFINGAEAEWTEGDAKRTCYAVGSGCYSTLGKGYGW